MAVWSFLACPGSIGIVCWEFQWSLIVSPSKITLRKIRFSFSGSHSVTCIVHLSLSPSPGGSSCS